MSSATQDSQAGSAGFTANVSGITPPSMQGRRGAFLSDIIVELGFADREVVEDAVPTAASAGKTVGRFLLDSGVLSDEQLSIAIAERSGLEHVDLDRFDVDSAAATLISRSVAMRYNALPIAFAPDGALVVAVADPSDFLGISDIEVITKTEVRLAIANPERIQELIEHLPEPEPSLDLPEPPEPLPDVQADPIAAPDGARAADTNGDSAGDRAAIAEREDEVDREELHRLRGQLADATGERDRLGQEIEQIRHQLADVTGERDRLGQELDQLRRQLADVTGERERLGQELDQLRRQLADVTGERDRLGQEIALAAEEQERLGGELEQIRRQLSDATEERERLRGQIGDGDGERERLGQELDQLRRQLADVTGERDHLGGELDQLRLQLADATGERDRLGRELELAAEERERPPTEAQRVEPRVDRAGGEVPLTEEVPLAEAEPLNTVALDQVTLNMKKGTATVHIRVEGVGHVLLTGRGVKDSFAAADGAGNATLAVVPTGKKRRKLEATGRAKVEVSVMFVPTSGDLRTQAMAITLVKRMDR